MITKREYLRMIQWLWFAAMLYLAAMLATNAQAQTGLWKAGHITSGAFIGYWIDRNLFGRFTSDHCYTPRAIARAIVVGCAILGMAFGL